MVKPSRDSSRSAQKQGTTHFRYALSTAVFRRLIPGLIKVRFDQIRMRVILEYRRRDESERGQGPQMHKTIQVYNFIIRNSFGKGIGDGKILGHKYLGHIVGQEYLAAKVGRKKSNL